jgi:hypothetical protein
MFRLRCPDCGTDSAVSLVDSVYEGPFRCWKCRGLFTVRIENDELKSYKPLKEEELAKED